MDLYNSFYVLTVKKKMYYKVVVTYLKKHKLLNHFEQNVNTRFAKKYFIRNINSKTTTGCNSQL